MTEDELLMIEADLHVTLPQDYRELLLAFPFRPLGNDRVYWLYDSPGSVIQATREPLSGYYEGLDWLPSYVAIGETAMCDQYLIDTARTPSPVFCLSHETHEFEDEFPTLGHFVEYWTTEVNEIRRQFNL